MPIIEGPEGQALITPGQIKAMSLAEQAQITTQIQHYIDTHPTVKVEITDTPDGGLRIEWRTKK